MPTNNIDNVRSDCTSGSVFSLTGKNQKILQVRQVSNYRQSPSFTVCMHNQVLHWDACLRVLHPSVHAIPPAGWGRRRKWLLYVYLTLPSWQRKKKKRHGYTVDDCEKAPQTKIASCECMEQGLLLQSLVGLVQQSFVHTEVCNTLHQRLRCWANMDISLRSWKQSSTPKLFGYFSYSPIYWDFAVPSATCYYFQNKQQT